MFALLLLGAALAESPPDEMPIINAAPRAEGASRWSRFDVALGVSGSGPLLFADLPDDRLAPTSVFGWGARAAFRFGDPAVDDHRFGVAFGFQGLARDDLRSLRAFDPALLYAAGERVEVQAGLGYRVAIASPGFLAPDGKAPYAGPLASLELRKELIDGHSGPPLVVTAAAFAEGVLALPDPSYSSAFGGLRLELAWRHL